MLRWIIHFNKKPFVPCLINNQSLITCIFHYFHSRILNSSLLSFHHKVGLIYNRIITLNFAAEKTCGALDVWFIRYKSLWISREIMHISTPRMVPWLGKDNDLAHIISWSLLNRRELWHFSLSASKGNPTSTCAQILTHTPHVWHFSILIHDANRLTNLAMIIL